MRSFASDNNSGVHPAIFEALLRANQDHAIGYGDDPWTREAEQQFQQTFGRKSQVFFVYSGTGANIVSLGSALQGHHAILCADTAHIHVDECAAPERFTGAKVIPLPAEQGKLRPEQLLPYLAWQGVCHHPQPAVLSISQPTELGTVYSIEELKELVAFAKKQGLVVHMDGARLANAAAALDCELSALTSEVDIDLLSFGGTKNGLMFGEAIVCMKQPWQEILPFVRKQGMQLHSKMRFIACQFSAYLKEDLWRHNAHHANEKAQELLIALQAVAPLNLVTPRETNALFVTMKKNIAATLKEAYFFYDWDLEREVIRLMTSFDTTSEDIAQLASRYQRCLGG
jgi:threonine aldolase